MHPQPLTSREILKHGRFVGSSYKIDDQFVRLSYIYQGHSLYQLRGSLIAGVKAAINLPILESDVLNLDDPIFPMEVFDV